MPLVRMWVHHGLYGPDPRDRPHTEGNSCTCRPNLCLVDDATGRRFALEDMGASWRCFTAADLKAARALQNAEHRAVIAAQRARPHPHVGRLTKRPVPVSLSPAAQYPAIDFAGGRMPWDDKPPSPQVDLSTSSPDTWVVHAARQNF